MKAFSWGAWCTLSVAALTLACGGGNGGNQVPPSDGPGGQAGSGGGGASGGAGGASANGGSAGDQPQTHVEYVGGVSVATLAGSSEAGNTDGALQEARFNNPVNVAVAPSGDVYVADFDNGTVRRITPDGTVATVFSDPRLVRPFGILVMPSGKLYLQADGNTQGQTDTTTGTLWRVDPDAGSGEVLIENAGRPRGIAARPDGQLLLVDVPAHSIHLFDPVTQQMSPFSGVAGQEGYVDGDASTARFRHPYGASLRPSGELVVADLDNHAVRVVAIDGSVSTLAGTGIAGMVDGPAQVAQFNQPKDVAAAPNGTIYVSDTGNHRIRVIGPDGTVRTLAGDGVAGYLNGSGEEARFFGQEGLDLMVNGKSLVVADGNNGEPLPYNRIRLLSLQP